MKTWPKDQPTAEWVELLPVPLAAEPAESVPIGLRVLASKNGIVVADEPRRVLGYEQLRKRIAILQEAADFAESRGCPDYLVER